MIDMSPLHHFHKDASRRHPEILYKGNEGIRQFALTFDDGPHPQDTARLLDVLERHQVRATFHLVGRSVERYPDLVRQVHRCGHQLALHCYRHIPFPLEKPTALRTGLVRSQNAIASAADIPPTSIRDLRPPYGLLTNRNLSQLVDWGFRLVMWSCLPPHWMQPAGWSIRQVMAAAVPGAVIALHDGHGHGKRVARIVDEVIPRIQSLGFEFITVEEMQAQLNQGISSPYNPKNI